MVAILIVFFILSLVSGMMVYNETGYSATIFTEVNRLSQINNTNSTIVTGLNG